MGNNKLDPTTLDMLKEYLQHKEDCATIAAFVQHPDGYTYLGVGPCDCGLDQILLGETKDK